MLSHVFPGFLLIISLFMLIDSFCINPGIYSCAIFTNQKLEIFILIIGIILLLGTIFGIIIDGIQHVTISKFFNKKIKKRELNKEVIKIYEIIESIYLDDFLKENGMENTEIEKFKKNILNWFFYYPIIDTEKHNIIKENFYYYYEFFANIFLVFVVTIFSVFCYTNNVLNHSYSWLITSFVIILAFTCLYIAWYWFEGWYKIRVNFLLGTLRKKSKSDTKFKL